MTRPADSELLVIYKPEGLRRVCTDDEARHLVLAWTSVLRWLRGADPDELPESALVGHVARKAALRIPRFPEYDVRLWAEHARGLAHLPNGNQAAGPLAGVVAGLLTSIHLQRTCQERCWLNRVAIEHLYGGVASFEPHRQVLIPRLLDGPVSIERWTGQRLELALASKFLVRRALSAEAVTNLVHVEITTADRAANLLKAVEIPAMLVDESGCMR
ncbi:MAG: hypothetical protein GEV28_16555 [Actinophytocola sp.]|uniref:hypothetical protein n=1 Tax=Actinophytocola sp. TaxID=1872138 RepID=UPI001323E157|nr:hypothetical protein [Actinophytocola sp.]MPZ81910.1 hypothetical protein [Actinophytocola sp.]